jgi:Ser/Thr protein kinase RdoA (MazF antagonist)
MNDLRNEASELTEAFVRAYSTMHLLSELEQRLLPTFQAIHHLWILGTHAASADEWGVLRLEQGLLARATNDIRNNLD